VSDAGGAYATLAFTQTFLTTLCGKEFSAAERRAFVTALGLLDEDDRHRSLRVHELRGDLAGMWSASASDSLRMTFLRIGGGSKVMLACSRPVATSSAIHRRWPPSS
jgi:mRNA-degrading endonuclease YafQ of YafQ-DinJ toxin-antitoxin module